MKSALVRAVSAGSEGPLGLALVPGRSLVNVHATDGAQAALLPVPAPVARKPPPAAVVKQDLGASAMVPAAAAVAAVLLALLQV